jgi:hypothetical protein
MDSDKIDQLEIQLSIIDNKLYKLSKQSFTNSTSKSNYLKIKHDLEL